MSAAAPMTESRPAAVRVLAVLLALTALATASVEWLNWYYAIDGATRCSCVPAGRCCARCCSWC
ncbi:hypothetical protein ACFQZ4_36000 [Catellatospora coxensis]